ncbi:unnamed protein product [Effrenium voratum]|nr:unnamed protein product [Effrenium voratum]
MIRAVCGAFALALGVAGNECQHGYAFLHLQSNSSALNSTTATVAATSALHCQQSCVLQASCHFFVFEGSAGCFLLETYTKLVEKATAVSGHVHCNLDTTEEETEAKHKARITRSILAMTEFVAKWSTDEEEVAIAEHLAWSVENGFLSEEDYDSIAALNTATAMLINSPKDFKHAAAQGMMLTRDDLDWLLQHTVGKHEQPEEKVALQGDLVDGSEEESSGAEEKGPSGEALGFSDLASYGAGKPWTNAQVLYCFDPNIAGTARKAVECAMGRIRTNVMGISFIDVGYSSAGRCVTKPAIFIQSSESGCWANIGMSSSLSLSSWLLRTFLFKFPLAGGAFKYVPTEMEAFRGPRRPRFGFGSNQKLNLQTPGCNDCGTATHEMLHALGMAHEQSRPDRDNYVSILWSNVKNGMEDQFTTNSKADISHPYDIMSIMHYGSMSFTKNGMDTIHVKPAGYALYTQDPGRFRYFRIGQRMHMSKQDVEQLKDLYGCAGPDNSLCIQSSSKALSAGLVWVGSANSMLVLAFGSGLVLSACAFYMFSKASGPGQTSKERSMERYEPLT